MCNCTYTDVRHNPMKQTLLILFLAFVAQVNGQTKDTVYLKGLPDYHYNKELIEKYDSLDFYQAKVDTDRKVCLLFADTTKGNYLIFLVQESYENDSLWHTQLDYIKIDKFPEGGAIAIGSREFDLEQDEAGRTGIIISVECCYDYEEEYAFYKSNKILELWSNQNGNDIFIKLNPEDYVRYNEGFYKKNKIVPNKK